VAENRRGLVSGDIQAIEFRVGSFLPSSVVVLMNGVSSQRPAGCCTTHQEHSCSLEKDEVRWSAYHIVAERAGIAHCQILSIGRDVGWRPDTRGGREVSAHFFGCEDSLQPPPRRAAGSRPTTDRIQKPECGSGAFRRPGTPQRLAYPPGVTDLARCVALFNPDVRELSILRSSNRRDAVGVS
jgi:hypothetical protein